MSKVTYSPSKYRIVTFNTLHLAHELNYAWNGSPVLDKYLGTERKLENTTLEQIIAAEKKRLADLANKIMKELWPNGFPTGEKKEGKEEKGKQYTILCLQECPGDLLSLLEMHDPDNRVIMYKYKYSRKPTLKLGPFKGKEIYEDGYEYLVTLIPRVGQLGQDLDFDDSAVCSGPTDIIQFEDPGKACLAVTIPKFGYVLNVHMPWISGRHEAVMDIFRWLEKRLFPTFVLAGDMNMPPGTFIYIVSKELQLPCMFVLPCSGSTRKGYERDDKTGELTLQSSPLDYFVTQKHVKLHPCYDGASRAVHIAENDDTSDHTIVSMIVSL